MAGEAHVASLLHGNPSWQEKLFVTDITFAVSPQLLNLSGVSTCRAIFRNHGIGE